MSGKIQKKTSQILLVFFISLICVSFMFTGYETMRKSSNTVAKVGSYIITHNELQSEINRQIQYYKQFMGGNELTNEQIEKYKIRKNSLNNLVNYKLSLKLANQLGIKVNNKEVKEEIRKINYFKSNGKFDVNLYKRLLVINQINPNKFEEDIKNNLINQKTTQLLNEYYPISKEYINDINIFKNMRKYIHLVQIDKNNLIKFIEVKPEQIDEFLKNKSNTKKAKEIFNQRKFTLSKPEKAKVRHILIKDKEKAMKIYKKVNNNNFSKLAKEYTEDPSGVKNGGMLRWFSKGIMAKKFEDFVFSAKIKEISKPIKTQFGYHIIQLLEKKEAIIATFEKEKENIYKEIIRKRDLKNINRLTSKIQKSIKENLNNDNIKNIKSIAKKYNLVFKNKSIINKYDGLNNIAYLNKNNLSKIFTSKDNLITFKDNNVITIIKRLNKKPEELTKKTLELEINKDKLSLSRKFFQSLINNIKESTKIKIFLTI